MRTKTTIVSSVEKTSACAHQWLIKAMGDSHANWNSDRFAYISRLIFVSLQKNNWLENVEEVSLYFVKNNITKESMLSLCEYIGIEDAAGNQKQIAATVFSSISAMLIHLALEGHIELRYGHQLYTPPKASSFEWFYRRGLFAESISHIYMLSSPPKTQHFWNEIPSKYKPLLKEWDDNRRSSRQRAGMNLLEAVVYSKVLSLDLVTTEVLACYYSVNSAAFAQYMASNETSPKASTVTYTLFMELLDFANGTTIQQEYERLMSSGKLTTRIPNVMNQQSQSFSKTISSKTAISNMTCAHLDLRNLVIETKVREVNILKVGDHSFSVLESKQDFLPENMPKSGYWNLTQRDYLNQKTEKGTRKTRSQRLALLNSYLFDYLPTFFEKHPNCGFDFPTTPSKFLDFVFINFSETILAANNTSNSITAYPVSLIDYIYAVTDEKAAANGYTRTNAGRDAVRTIQQYFDFIVARFSSIPECRISHNPISNWDKDSRKGYKYSKSSKELIDLDYWILLRKYLIEVTKVALENAESVLSHKASNQQVFKINKTIEWLDYKVHIDSFDATNLRIFNNEDWKDPIKFTEYQGLLTLTIIAWSGLRHSNVRWLDVRSYAQRCPEDYLDDDFVELFVNTDKVRTEPYTSQIPGFLMRLIDKAASLRCQVNRHGFMEPIPYQGESDSKWPAIKPLLQSTKTNGDIFLNNFLLHVLTEFEGCLRENTNNDGTPLTFNTSIYKLPLYANARNFRETRAAVHAEQDYTALLKNTKTGESLRFTPFKEAVIWTVHSLRLTFDSVCSVLADPETVGKVSTGQSPETVGYYSKCNIEQTKRIRHIQRNSGFEKQLPSLILSDEGSVASINDTKLDKAKYLEKYAKRNHSGLHTLSSIDVHGLKSPIQTLIQASAHEIAFNRTHICPFNNECPRPVIQALAGEKTCALCPYAIFCEDHAIAISAEVKRLGDICADISYSLKNSDQLMESEVSKLKLERAQVIKSISGWLVRHKLLAKKINSGEFYVGAKDDLIIKHVSGSSSGSNLLKRLIETDGVSTMTSAKLERESLRLNRQLMALANKNPEALESQSDYHNSAPQVAVQMIKTLCNVNDISLNQLSGILENPAPSVAQIGWVESL